MSRYPALVAATLALLAIPAFAQDRGSRGGTPGQFDFYVLALSWSPGFCEATGTERGSAQCETGRNLGFVTHGLWPQYEHGFPSGCGARREAPRSAIDATGNLYPDRGLARHEWRLHGTCSGLGPSEYFAAVAKARAAVTIPEPMRRLGAESRTTGQSIERAFAESNPGLRPDMMSVSCRRGALQEVRICMTKELTGFRTCPELDRQRSCGFGPIRVAAPR